MRDLDTSQFATIKKQLNRLGRLGIPFLCSISYDATTGWVYPLTDLPNTFNYSFPSHFSTPQIAYRKGNTGIKLTYKAPSLSAYQKAFSVVQEALHRGDTYLCNLTTSTSLLTSLSLAEIYAHSVAKYKLLTDSYIFFSPETFVTISEEGAIATFPMKGTIDATLLDAENRLLNDAKEAAEHATIVDLLRNDLSIVAQDVHVPRFRYIEKITTSQGALLQSSSEICGTLSSDWQEHIGDIFEKLLPAGSITGAPKPATIALIEEAETTSRGYYTGVTILFDGSTIDSCVNIRFIKEQEGNLYYHSGGGITAQSSCEQEYQELLEKIYVPTT